MLGNINIAQMVTVAINLIILYLFMRRFLFKPVTAYMENRSNGIKNAMDDAEKAKNEAADLKTQYGEQLKAARAEADRIAEDARVKAGQTYDKTLDAAKKDAEALLTKAREAIERERADMLREVKNQVAGLALAAASMVIQANMDTESNRALVDKFLAGEGVA